MPASTLLAPRLRAFTKGRASNELKLNRSAIIDSAQCAPIADAIQAHSDRRQPNTAVVEPIEAGCVLPSDAYLRLGPERIPSKQHARRAHEPRRSRLELGLPCRIFVDAQGRLLLRHCHTTTDREHRTGEHA